MPRHRCSLVAALALLAVGCRARVPAPPPQRDSAAKPAASSRDASPPPKPARVPRSGPLKLADLGAMRPSVAPYLEGTLKDDRRQGVWTSWYAPGHKAAEVTYRDGMRAGPFSLYWSDGTLAAKGRYRNGRAEGLSHADGGSWNAILPIELRLEQPLASLHSLCGALVAVTADHKLHARGRSQLEPIWQFALPGPLAKPLLERDGKLGERERCLIVAETAAGSVVLDGYTGKLAELPEHAEPSAPRAGKEIVLGPAPDRGADPPTLRVDEHAFELAPDGKSVIVHGPHEKLESGPWRLPRDLICPGRLTVIRSNWDYAFACPGQTVIRMLRAEGKSFLDLTSTTAVRWRFRDDDHEEPYRGDGMGAVVDEGLVFYLTSRRVPPLPPDEDDLTGCTYDLYSGARLVCVESRGGPPVLARGVLYLWSPEGRRIEARDALSGDLLWNRPWFDAADPPASSDRVPMRLSKDGHTLTAVAGDREDVRALSLDAATGAIVKSGGFAAQDIGKAGQDYFQVDGALVAFAEKNGTLILDTASIETRCNVEGHHSAYLLVPGRAILLGERSVFAISTKSCKRAWFYSTRNFVVLSMQIDGQVLHLSGMEIGNGEPLETWEDLDLATGRAIEGSRPRQITQPRPAWQIPPWTQSGDIVGFTGGDGPPLGLDQRRTSAGHTVAADPEPRLPASASVDAGNPGSDASP
jgi:hypothetical protein